MKPIRILMLASIALAAPAISHAQVAGTTLLGVSVEEMRNVALGWSVKRTILGQPVYNDNNERVGSIDDIIIAPERRFPTPLSMPAASSGWRSTMSPFPFPSSSLSRANCSCQAPRRKL